MNIFALVRTEPLLGLHSVTYNGLHAPFCSQARLCEDRTPRRRCAAGPPHSADQRGRGETRGALHSSLAVDLRLTHAVNLSLSCAVNQSLSHAVSTCCIHYSVNRKRKPGYEWAKTLCH